MCCERKTHRQYWQTMRTAVPYLLCITLLAGCAAEKETSEQTASGNTIVTLSSSSSSDDSSSMERSVTSESTSSIFKIADQPSQEEDMAFLRGVITEATNAGDAMEMLLDIFPDNIRMQVREAISALQQQTQTLEKFHDTAKERQLSETERMHMTEEVAIIQEGIDAFAQMIEILSNEEEEAPVTE